MKTPVIILFAIWIFTAYFYTKKVKSIKYLKLQNKYLKSQIAIRDSVNTANAKAFEAYRKDSADYSLRFKKLLNKK